MRKFVRVTYIIQNKQVEEIIRLDTIVSLAHFKDDDKDIYKISLNTGLSGGDFITKESYESLSKILCEEEEK